MLFATKMLSREWRVQIYKSVLALSHSWLLMFISFYEMFYNRFSHTPSEDIDTNIWWRYVTLLVSLSLKKSNPDPSYVSGAGLQWDHMRWIIFTIEKYFWIIFMIKFRHWFTIWDEIFLPLKYFWNILWHIYSQLERI